MEKNSKYDLIICEKDQQAENISNALGLDEDTFGIQVPSKEYSKLEKSLNNPKKQLKETKKKIAEVEKEYRDKGKEDTLPTLKKYTSLKEKEVKYTQKIREITSDMTNYANGMETKQMRFWKGTYDETDLVLVSCTGHLLGIKLTTKDEDMHTDEDSDDDDSDDDDGDENGLNFYTKIKPPSPHKEAEISRWLKLKLIEHFVVDDFDNNERIICATDFDREGQVIFGLIMEYYNIDLNSCLRMKFHTLEEDAIREAYDNMIDFDVNLFNAGKMRQWSDYVIGFNINPVVSNIYRGVVEDYLNEQGIDEDTIKRVKYAIGFNIGRVKLVILKHIFDETSDHIENASTFSPESVDEKEKMFLNMKIKADDHSQTYTIVSHTESIIKWLKGYSFDDVDNIHLVADITKIQITKDEKSIDNVEVPSFLNLTKVFQVCSQLGASTEEINTVLEYLYLQKYISYPRSKSEKWEIDDEDDRKTYAHSVLDMLDGLGYPMKKSYYDGYGNEGSESHSHPCIHPLPSVTPERVQLLKKLNPLGHLVFNEICIYTMECFEKLPIIETQKINFNIIDLDKGAEVIHNIVLSNDIGVVEPNILTFEGYQSTYSFFPPFIVSEKTRYPITIEKSFKKVIDVSSIREKPEFITDFDVVNFLNENDIGTDATRAVLLKDLIEKQYIVSDKVLLTTFLGNQMHLIADHYIDFIDLDYTLEMEKDLNKIETGAMEMREFMDKVKAIIIETCNKMQNDKDFFGELFDEFPECEKHEVKMVLSNGKFGKFMVCPRYYEDGCDQKFSL